MAERKRFIDVELPLIDSTVRVLGTPEELDTKTIKLDLSRRMRGKGINVIFQIFNREGKLIAFPKKMELVRPYIRRMMRKRIDYVEDSFTAQCKDIRTIVKPFLITRKQVSRAVRRNLRNTAREFLLDYLKDRDYNDICEELMDSILQKTLLPKLKKVYPLSFCDLRIFETKEIEKMNLDNAIAKKPEVVKEDTDAPEAEETKEEPVEVKEAEEKVEKAVKKTTKTVKKTAKKK
jgi:ribosomal protein S3AE